MSRAQSSPLGRLFVAAILVSLSFAAFAAPSAVSTHNPTGCKENPGQADPRHCTPSYTLNPASPNANGWYNVDVTVSWADNVCAQNFVTADTPSTGVTFTCQGTTTAPIKRDATAPTWSLASRTPAANGNGWNNANVAVVWTCADALSGPPSSTVEDLVDGEGAAQTASAICADNAGNQATATESGISIDKTSPTVAEQSRFPSANAFDWHNADVTVTFSCADALSGPVAATVSDVVAAEGASQTATAACQDLAGNTASGTATGVNLDETAPTSGGSVAGTSGDGGWYVSPVTVTLTATDALSGVQATRYTIDAGATETYAGPFTLTTDGTHAVKFWSLDRADNEEPDPSLTVPIDRTPPTLATTLLPAAAPTGWWNAATGAPTVSFSCADATSGIPAGTCPASHTFGAGLDRAHSDSVSDAAGNVATAGVSGLDVDLSLPVITAPSALTVEATSGSGAPVSYASSVADDLDATPAFGCLPASGSTFPIGATTVTCAAQDDAGNGASHSFVVTVQDSSGPSFALPGAAGTLVVAAENATGAVATYVVTASDAVDGPVAVSCAPASGSRFPLGATTVTCTATDSRGNMATGTFVVDVQDQAAPVLDLPEDATRAAINRHGAIVDFDAFATDNVDASVVPSCAPASGSAFPLGSTVVTCVAADAAGNAASDSFTITLTDQASPQVEVPADALLEATSASGAPFTFTVTVTDNVDEGLEAACSRGSGDVFPLGVTAVTCAATDAAGNPGSASFTVTVVDTTPPDVLVPAAIETEATSPSGTPVAFAASAHDLVDGAIEPVCAPASSDAFPLGTTTVTCTATDAAGNGDSASFTVTVVDTTDPVLEVPDATVVGEASSSTGGVVTYETSAQDAGAGTLDVLCSPPSGATFPLGLTTVTCTAEDPNGNAVSATFQVSVVDSTAPALLVPSDRVVPSPGGGSAVVDYEVFAVDAVDGDLIPSCSPASGSPFELGATTVACTVTDGADNTATDSFTITLVDDTPPTLVFPETEPVAETSGASAVVEFTVTATDSGDSDVEITCAPASGSTFPRGASEVVCTARDDAGLETTDSFFVHVRNTSPPTLEVSGLEPASAASAAGAVVAFSVSAADDLDGARAATCAPGSGSVFPIGVTTVTCSASDLDGNEGTLSFDVTVTDTPSRLELEPLLGGAPFDPTQPILSDDEEIVFDFGATEDSSVYGTVNPDLPGADDPLELPGEDDLLPEGRLVLSDEGEWIVLVRAIDVNGVEGPLLTIPVLLDRTSPDITAIAVSRTETSLTVYWRTSEATTSQLLWGTGGAYGNTAASPVLAPHHNIVLTGLAPATTYGLRLVSVDRVGHVFSRDTTGATALPPVAPHAADVVLPAPTPVPAAEQQDATALWEVPVALPTMTGATTVALVLDPAATPDGALSSLTVGFSDAVSAAQEISLIVQQFPAALPPTEMEAGGGFVGLEDADSLVTAAIIQVKVLVDGEEVADSSAYVDSAIVRMAVDRAWWDAHDGRNVFRYTVQGGATVRLLVDWADITIVDDGGPILYLDIRTDGFSVFAVAGLPRATTGGGAGGAGGSGGGGSASVGGALDDWLRDGEPTDVRRPGVRVRGPVPPGTEVDVASADASAAGSGSGGGYEGSAGQQFVLLAFLIGLLGGGMILARRGGLLVLPGKRRKDEEEKAASPAPGADPAASSDASAPPSATEAAAGPGSDGPAGPPSNP